MLISSKRSPHRTYQTSRVLDAPFLEKRTVSAVSIVTEGRSKYPWLIRS